MRWTLCLLILPVDKGLLFHMVIEKLLIEYPDERVWVSLHVLADFFVAVAKFLHDHVDYALI